MAVWTTSKFSFMKLVTTICLFWMGVCTISSQAIEQVDTYDYFRNNKEMISSGVQAILTCNGIFTSERTIEQVYDQELKYLPQPLGSAQGGDYHIDYDRKTVSIGTPGGTPVMRAVFREGIGCIILAPDQGFDVIDDLPIQTLPIVEGDASAIPWPDGDLVPDAQLDPQINKTKLQSASDWAFDRDTPEQNTISLIIAHKGQIIHERYAEGFDMHTKTRTWSTAKSIAAT